ncbi:MAG: hypothetical protein EBV82_09100, partial [Chitinophagia bacterium]|nr:hypothetical protein [Chitinophagia bacterium]
MPLQFGIDILIQQSPEWKNKSIGLLTNHAATSTSGKYSRKALIENGFQIAAKSPEALIRFSSYVVQGQSIHLSGARKFGMSIELPKKAEGKATINVVAQDDFADQWMNTKKFGSPDLS